MVDVIMVEVEKYLQEVGHFVKTIHAPHVIVEIKTKLIFPDDIETHHPFLKSSDITVNTEVVTLADIVERDLIKVKSGEDVVVVLADNRQMATTLEHFKCNVPVDSTLTAVEIVNKAKVKFFEGENYYDEEVL